MEINRETIIALETQLIAGIRTSDVKLLDTLLHNDLLFIAPNGQPITKEIDLASHSAGEMIVEELSPTIENINIIDDTAVVIVVYKREYAGQPHSGTISLHQILKTI